MTKEQEMVKEFMIMFKQHIPNKPIQMDEETAKLRANLIFEEALETITKGLGLEVCCSFEKYEGVDEKVYFTDESLKSRKARFSFIKQKEVDNVELADGLADLHYVAYCGTGVAAGLDMEPIFKEVDDSNKTKMWTEEDLVQAKELYPTAKVEVYGEGLYRLIREDGKIIKSPSYRPANIKGVLETQN